LTQLMNDVRRTEHGGVNLINPQDMRPPGRAPGQGDEAPMKLAIFCILTSMISAKIYCMKNTIKLQLAALAKLKIAFVELCKCKTALLLYSCTIYHIERSRLLFVNF
jgi:hypothetical protein